jgi:N-acetylneuraminate synthase/N,N'-diacetyllegionaminate synthase
MSAVEPLFLIPVRGGSKSVPRKNLRTVAGISLLGRAVHRALRARQMLGGGGRVVVDTDDPALMEEARRHGAEVPYRRPAHLATDTARTMDVVRHCLAALDVRDDRPVVLLQATTPLTPPDHVFDVVRAWLDGDGAPVVSVSTPDHPPAWCFGLAENDVLAPQGAGEVPHQRQGAAPSVRVSGAVYVAGARALRDGGGFVEPGRTRAVTLDRRYAVDIDDPTDLAVAEALAGEGAPTITVGDRTLGAGNPCFVIAEAGVNHDGDVSVAHALIDAAAYAGADAVKFQTWRTELVVRPGMRTADYQRANMGAEDQHAMLRALELPYEAHYALREHATAVGLMFLSTPDEIESARFLAALGVPAIKIGSGDLDNHLLLAQVAALGRPMLVSTGMAEMHEVTAALDVIADHGAPPVALFHAVSDYPARVEDMNVRALRTLRDAYNVPVGLSDHAVGPEAMLAAVGIGLSLWEKHITLDTGRHGPDHAASLDPREFARQVRLLRDAERALGDGVKRPRVRELATRPVVRKRLHLAHALPAGHALTADDLVALRADEGLPASEFLAVRGRALRVALDAGAPLTHGLLA